MDYEAQKQADRSPNSPMPISNNASIQDHIQWVLQDLETTAGEIRILEEALAGSTDASKISGVSERLEASRQLITELEDVLQRYHRMNAEGLHSTS